MSLYFSGSRKKHVFVWPVPRRAESALQETSGGPPIIIHQNTIKYRRTESPQSGPQAGAFRTEPEITRRFGYFDESRSIMEKHPVLVFLHHSRTSHYILYHFENLDCQIPCTPIVFPTQPRNGTTRLYYEKEDRERNGENATEISGGKA